MYFISSGKVHSNAVASVDSGLSFPLAVSHAMRRLERCLTLEDAACEKLVELIGSSPAVRVQKPIFLPNFPTLVYSNNFFCIYLELEKIFFVDRKNKSFLPSLLICFNKVSLYYKTLNF